MINKFKERMVGRESVLHNAQIVKWFSKGCNGSMIKANELYANWLKVAQPHDFVELTCPICSIFIDAIDLYTEKKEVQLPFTEAEKSLLDFEILDIERNDILGWYNSSDLVPIRCPNGHNLWWGIAGRLVSKRVKLLEYDKYLDILKDRGYSQTLSKEI